MGNFQIIPESKSGVIESPSDIGLDLIVEKMAEFIGKDRLLPKLSEEEQERRSLFGIENDQPEKKWVDPAAEEITEVLKNWVYGFETDASTIHDRRQIVKQALENPKFTHAIDSSSIKPFDFKNMMYAVNSNSRTRDFFLHAYEHHALKRFENYVACVSSFKESLGDYQDSAIIKELSNSLSARLIEAEELKQKLDINLEPVVKIKVKPSDLIKFYHKYQKLYDDKQKGYVYRVDHNESLSARNEVLCKVMNRLTDEEFDFKLKFSQKFKFLKNILDQFGNEWGKKSLVERLNLNLSLFFSQLTLEAEFKPDPSNKTIVKGEVKYLKNSRICGTYEGILNFYDSSFRSFIEQRMLEQNFPLLENFDEKIVSFEGMLKELKAISAASHYVKAVQEKGYPSVFPKIAEGDSRIDIAIVDMFNPLYTLHFERRVMPNNVETTPEKNVVIITGANENGKSTYMNGLGQTYAFFQAGLPIFANAAEMTVKDKLLVHRVNPGDIGTTSSRHAYECKVVTETAQKMTYKTLLLCDELFTGTAPSDGIACSTHFIDFVVQTGGTGLFVSHYMPLAQGYEKCSNVALKCFKLDHTKEPPFTFRMEPGVAESSEGEAVATKYGVSDRHFNFILGQKEFNNEIIKRPLIK
ncbi:MAG: hypothetical protein Q8O89_01945 [Nanoarchaeota archaeon]|nr:hypothetical protein [Nanoarchaeota archaeon]